MGGSAGVGREALGGEAGREGGNGGRGGAFMGERGRAWEVRSWKVEGGGRLGGTGGEADLCSLLGVAGGGRGGQGLRGGVGGSFPKGLALHGSFFKSILSGLDALDVCLRHGFGRLRSNARGEKRRLQSARWEWQRMFATCPSVSRRRTDTCQLASTACDRHSPQQTHSVGVCGSAWLGVDGCGWARVGAGACWCLCACCCVRV